MSRTTATEDAPDERALLAWVVPQVDAAMLDEIAAADYGFDAPAHREALEWLRSAAKLPDEVSWYPGEVLALTRWQTPGDRRDHLKRLFVCLLLVRAASDNGDPVQSLAPLVDSAWELGPEARAAAVRFVTWCRRHLPGDWRDDPSSAMFLTLAVLLLSADATTSVAMARELIDELDKVLADPELPWRSRPGSPLFTRRTTELATTRRLWLALVTRCLIDGPAAADPRLAALGRALTAPTEPAIGELRALFTVR